MTDAAPNSILAKTAKGAGWIIGWRMVTRVLGLISTLILVRLLLPSDFGLVTLAVSFGQAIDSLSSLGVEEAVIREKEPSVDLYNSAFTINVIRGLGTAVLLAAGAWPIGVFFGDMRLVPVLLFLALGALISSCENIGIVDFRRNMTFEKEFLLMSAPRVASILIAISLAYVFRSYWALIVAMLSATVMRIAMGYVLHPFRPRLGLRAWRQIAGFSFWSWLLSLSSLVRDRCDTFVIGRMLGITQVGIFSVGLEIANLPSSELVSPLARACFSGFAATRNSGTPAETAETFTRVLASTTLLALPAGIGISLVADPIVKLAFGARWDGATEVIQVLGVALSVMILGLISAALLNAYAMLRGTFKVQLAAIAVRIPVVLVLVSQMGLPGATIGAAVGTAVEHLLYLAMAMRQLHLTPLDLLRHTWRSLVGVIAMAVALATLGLGWSHAPDDVEGQFTALFGGAALGACVYAGAVVLLWLASGRPKGAEQDMAVMIHRMFVRALSVLRRQWSALHGHD